MKVSHMKTFILDCLFHINRWNKSVRASVNLMPKTRVNDSCIKTFSLIYFALLHFSFDSPLFFIVHVKESVCIFTLNRILLDATFKSNLTLSELLNN